MSSESCAAIPRHDAHFDGRRVAWKASAIQREPVPFRELEQHRGIAARRYHAPCWRGWCKPEFLQVLAAFGASDAIPSVQQVGRSPIGIKHRGRGWELLDVPTGCLTAVAIAGSADNRSATSLEDDVTAIQRSESVANLSSNATSALHPPTTHAQAGLLCELEVTRTCSSPVQARDSSNARGPGARADCPWRSSRKSNHRFKLYITHSWPCGALTAPLA